MWSNKMNKLVLSVFILFAVSSASAQVENVTLEMELDAAQVYVDGEAAEEKTYTDLDFPYIVSDQPIGIVSFGDFLKLEYADGSTDKFSMTQNRGSFILLNTVGGYTEIEGKKAEIQLGDFPTLVKPSFGFAGSEKALVKVSLKPRIDIVSELRLSPGDHQIVIKNTRGKIEIS